MVRRATRLLITGFAVFGFISICSFWYGDQGAAMPRFQMHGATAVDDDPALKLKVSERRIKEVQNSTLGVRSKFLPTFAESKKTLTFQKPLVPKRFRLELPRPT